MILCEHPRYIVHPHARKNILRYGNYTLDGVPHFNDLSFSAGSSCLDMASFWQRCLSLDSESYDKSYVTDTRTGQCFPLFMEVSCGHCVLCRDRKKKSIGFRCQAETNYWFAQGASSPLFVTLTYNNYYLPRTDDDNPTLCGSDVTLFLKRLRQQLIRRYGKDVAGKLRYFLCGEYGHNTHRPHYHILFWNFPNLGSTDNTRNLVSCLHAVEDAWSIIVGYLKNPVTGVPEPIYEQLGFVSCYEATTGASAYVAKYIGKHVPQLYAPDAQKPFFRASCGRIGGIGSLWLDSWIKDNPTLSLLDKKTWTLIDPYSGREVSTTVLPKYFVDKVYPTASAMLSAKVRYSLKMLESRWSQLTAIGSFSLFSGRVDCNGTWYVPCPTELSKVFDKYDYYPDFHRFGVDKGDILVVESLVRKYGILRVRSYLYHCIDYLIDFLSEFPFDKLVSQRNVDSRSSYYSMLFADSSLTYEDLNFVIESKNKVEYYASLREVV